ncbi:hypothetical protein AWJ20_2623 [Sugiyamaella lignohabitans]|uniref:Globin domain-containing protein n=1 Tax=Sugiyamaella lignohabitans TaxID=796027 RepID=A0A167F9Q7_9ASCO|nr:uncharacterized protein AWJ20_2623 [Sugiyamaella lignohabitans]ANB15004.1 hypothetical protein AWJ20_2623 [Sugiyamaella lignohabitans]
MAVLKKQFINPGSSGGSGTVSHRNSLRLDPADCVVFTPGEISLLRNIWKEISENNLDHGRGLKSSQASTFFCQQFYENLLGDHPSLQTLFPSLQSQSAAMAWVLGQIIAQLEDVSQAQSVLIKLAKWHSRLMNLEPVHYEYVGSSLLRTLGDRRGDKFTAQEENAWIKLYTFIANVMLKYGEDPLLPSETVASQLPRHATSSNPQLSVSNSYEPSTVLASKRSQNPTTKSNPAKKEHSKSHRLFFGNLLGLNTTTPTRT